VILMLLFTLDTDVRYVMPTVSVLAILAARGLEAPRPCSGRPEPGRRAGWWEKRWVLALLAAVAFAHLGATAWVVGGKRHLTEGQQAVFAYLRTGTPEETRVMYPGEVIMIEARRPVVWNHLTDPETGQTCLPTFLLETDPQKISTLLRFNKVDYLCVEESRILSGPLAKTERGGYPRAFADNLPNLPFVEKVEGPWPGVTLWKMKDDPRGPSENAPAGNGRPKPEPLP
jgi:hypothetical protein